jgi:hypothetical protein
MKKKTKLYKYAEDKNIIILTDGNGYLEARTKQKIKDDEMNKIIEIFKQEFLK